MSQLRLKRKEVKRVGVGAQRGRRKEPERRKQGGVSCTIKSRVFALYWMDKDTQTGGEYNADQIICKSYAGPDDRWWTLWGVWPRGRHHPHGERQRRPRERVRTTPQAQPLNQDQVLSGD